MPDRPATPCRSRCRSVQTEWVSTATTTGGRVRTAPTCGTGSGSFGGFRCPRASAGPGAPISTTWPNWSTTGPRRTTGASTRSASSTTRGCTARRDRPAVDPPAGRRRRADRGPAARLAGLVPALRAGAAAARRPQCGGARLPGLPVRGPGRPRRACRRRPWREVVASAMAELGYDRYVVSGGDIGSSVAEYAGRGAPGPGRRAAPHRHPVHAPVHGRSERADRGRADATSARVRQWQFAEGAYALEQATKPHTLAAGLATRRPGWRPGSWRSCAAGATATATSSRCSRATTCSPG